MIWEGFTEAIYDSLRDARGGGEGADLDAGGVGVERDQIDGGLETRGESGGDEARALAGAVVMLAAIAMMWWARSNPPTSHGSTTATVTRVLESGLDTNASRMVRVLLPGIEIANPDAADALAVAICHAHHAFSGQARAEATGAAGGTGA